MKSLTNLVRNVYFSAAMTVATTFGLNCAYNINGISPEGNKPTTCYFRFDGEESTKLTKEDYTFPKEKPKATEGPKGPKKKDNTLLYIIGTAIAGAAIGAVVEHNRKHHDHYDSGGNEGNGNPGGQ